MATKKSNNQTKVVKENQDNIAKKLEITATFLIVVF